MHQARGVAAVGGGGKRAVWRGAWAGCDPGSPPESWSGLGGAWNLPKLTIRLDWNRPPQRAVAGGQRAGGGGCAFGDYGSREVCRTVDVAAGADGVVFAGRVFVGSSRRFDERAHSRFPVSLGQIRERAIGNGFWESGCFEGCQRDRLRGRLAMGSFAGKRRLSQPPFQTGRWWSEATSASISLLRKFVMIAGSR